MSKLFSTDVECNKLTEFTVAFQVSTVKPEITPTDGRLGLLDRLKIAVTRRPKRLIPVAHAYMGDYPCRVGHVDWMYQSICRFDNCFDISGLISELSKIMLHPMDRNASSLVAVTIVDGRIIFKTWNPSGSKDIIVLPGEFHSIDNRFDFGLQKSRRSKNGIRIACELNGKEIHYIVEYYKRYKVYATKDIHYKLLQGKKGEKPHYIGYMETLTVR